MKSLKASVRASILVQIHVNQKPLGNGMAIRRVVVIAESIVEEKSDCKVLAEQQLTLEAALDKTKHDRGSVLRKILLWE